MSTSKSEEHRHAQFLDLCLLYADFNRPVFLEAFLRWFMDSASPAELTALRRAIRGRTKALMQNGKKGRPRAEHDPNWIRRSLQIVWQREILHWPWRKIAAAAGLAPTRPNIRTLQLRRDLYAEIVCHALPPHADLRQPRIQRILRSRLSFPFDSHPSACTRIVQALVPRGLAFEASRLRRPGK
jgi:hypothetical protein